MLDSSKIMTTRHSMIFSHAIPGLARLSGLFCASSRAVVAILLGTTMLSNVAWSQSSPAMSGTSPTPRATSPMVAPEITRTIELIELKRFGEAKLAISKALESKPRDPQWRFLDGLVLAETGQDRPAIDVFEAIAEEFPELAEPYNNLAVLYLRCNEPQRARQALERAIANRPGYALAYENLGDLHASLALEAYEKGLGARGTSPFLSAKRSHLRSLPKPAAFGLQNTPPPRSKQ